MSLALPSKKFITNHEISNPLFQANYVSKQLKRNSAEAINSFEHSPMLQRKLSATNLDVNGKSFFLNNFLFLN